MDARTNKEIATLSRKFAIDFVGVSREGKRPFFADQVHRVELIQGRSRSPATLAKLWWRVLVLRWKNHYDTVHVINEDLYLLLLPLLVGQRVVLDVFDSSFLKWRVPRWVAWLGQRLSYALPAKIIVTDEERAGLMPAFVQLRGSSSSPIIRSAMRDRPAGAIRRWFAFSTRVRCSVAAALFSLSSFWRWRRTCAWSWRAGFAMKARGPCRSIRRWSGWGCCRSRKPSRRPPVAISSSAITSRVNLNNIYASPNKIYDAIQAGAAIIINPEARVSRFVREHNLGVVLDAYRASRYEGRRPVYCVNSRPATGPTPRCASAFCGRTLKIFCSQPTARETNEPGGKFPRPTHHAEEKNRPCRRHPARSHQARAGLFCPARERDRSSRYCSHPASIAKCWIRPWPFSGCSRTWI